MTTGAAFENSIQDKQLYGLPQRTIEAYQSFVSPFVAFAGTSSPMEDLTNKTIKDYTAALYAMKLSKATIDTYARHIKVFLSWYQKVKEKSLCNTGFLFGTPSGARTLDTLIKSQVLYQLS